MSDRTAALEAALALAELARLDLPGVDAWHIGYEPGLGVIVLGGQLAHTSDPGPALDAWAEVLTGAERHQRPYTVAPGRGEVYVLGTYQGVTVKIWAGVTVPAPDALPQEAA